MSKAQQVLNKLTTIQESSDEFSFKKDGYAETRTFSNQSFKQLKKALDPLAKKYKVEIMLGFSAKYQTPYIYVSEHQDQLEIDIENALLEADFDIDNQSDPDRNKIKFDLNGE